MSQAAEQTAIELMQIDLFNLRRLAASESADFGGMAVMDGALPPPRAAVRALAQLDSGTPTLWCVPFLITSDSREAVLGHCGFKYAPSDGSVEVGYGVATSMRGQGIATAAVGRLLQLAASSGKVQQVVAHILPSNIASSKVAGRLGFSMGHSFLDSDGEMVVHWAYRVAI